MHSGGASAGASGGAAHRRRKKRSNYGIRTVEVNRGSNGFGFTISGQQPCILSCIVAGSPADLAGLRAGDFLISVNGLNVSKLPHESVVQLIGSTHGTIRMAIAENYYSDSSDEDIMFQHGVQQARSRPKYPHKAKFSRAIGSGMTNGGTGASGGTGTGVGSGINTVGLERPGAPTGAAPLEPDELLIVNDSSPPGATAYNVIHSPNASNSCDISNVSAMVRSVQLAAAGDDELASGSGTGGPSQDRHSALEYQAVVGYLGTIEMPKQIATSSKLQTVRSCIRKMRQEKRNPMTVLMTILPSCLNLTNTSNTLIAKYASARLSYVSSSSESDNKYFGLVTSAVYADGLMCDSADDVLLLGHSRKDVVISNSCHVFVIDGKLAVEHELHLEKAALFRIVCTKDPITNLCLEFPSNSEYVVNLIRSMYSLKSPVKACEGGGSGSGGGGGGGGRKPPVARSLNLDGAPRFPRNRSDPRLNLPRMEGADAHDVLAANSPQPSNHSEITTTSSNSDSGIGFHNDCRNISDRILLVDFPGMLGPQQQRLLQQQQIANVRAHYRKSHPFLRPAGIINEIPPKMEDPIRNIRSTTGGGGVVASAAVGQAHSSRAGGGGLQILHGKSKSADYSYPSTSAGGGGGGGAFVDRLTVRARPDPKVFPPSDRSPAKENTLHSCATMHEEATAAVRLMPEGDSELPPALLDDPWTYGGRTLDEQGNVVEERPIDVPPMEEIFLDLERYNNDNVKNSLLTARSCDDMILSLGKESDRTLAREGGQCVADGAPADVLLDAEAYERLKVKLSIDDLTLISTGLGGPSSAMMEPPDSAGSQVNGGGATTHDTSNQHVFLQPLKPVKRSKKACTTHTSKSASGKLAAVHHNVAGDDGNAGGSRKRGDKLAAYKLSPKVFGLPRPISISFENISTLDGRAGAGSCGTASVFDDAISGGAGTGGGDGGSSGGHKGSHKLAPHPGTPGGSGRKSRSTKRLSGGFSAIWGSLQELRSGGAFTGGAGMKSAAGSGGGGDDASTAVGGAFGQVGMVKKKKDSERRLSGLKLLEATYSEPDLRYDEVSAPNLAASVHDDDNDVAHRNTKAKQINHSASPFRRWGQSSLRSRSTEHRTPNGSARRPSSLAASESDVYTKSIDDDYSSTKSGYNPYGGVGGSGAGGGSCGDVLGIDAGMAMHGTGTGGAGGGGGKGTGSSGPTGVASWGTSFEKLLEDAAGLHTFSEFLKKEFSAENIYFWTACERYRQLTDAEERAREAQAIFARHLESGCSEPVNVDSIARNIALEHLPQAEPTLFAAPQKQIFNLMKFDSYQRFIKSDLYRVCQEAEAKGAQLPYPGDQLDPMLRTSFTVAHGGDGAAASGAVTKLKKSLSNAEDRRRKSLLPWHRKTRCKSKDRGDSDASKKEGGKGGSSSSNAGAAGGAAGGGGGGGGSSSSNTLKLLSTNSTSDIHSSRSSLASFDAAIGGKSYDPDDTRTTLCRVILSNGATTVVQTRSNETIKELVERLLEKRGIVYNAYEAFLASSSKPLDLDGPSVSLAGKEVNIDQRVVFKLNLPNRKMISVKSKATKPLADVLRPILHKYNYELDQMKVTDASDVGLDMTQPVTTVDGLCLYIRSAGDHSVALHSELGRSLAGARPVINTATHQQIVHHFQQQQQQQLQQQLLSSQPSTTQQQQQQQPHQFAVPSSNPSSYALAAGKGQRSLLGGASGAFPTTCNNNNNNTLNVNHNHLRGKDPPEQLALKEAESQAAPPSASRGQQELNTLDEITNKVFNELMNGKTAANGGATGKGGGPPDVDCASDTSSTRRDRFRRRGSNAPSESGRGAKSKKCSTAGSEDGGESVTNVGIKKPIIAKLKAGVKLQMPTRSQNDELLEGLKRAQRSRLEDQRGTEINFELPDFLKDKENFATATAGTGGGNSTVVATASTTTNSNGSAPSAATGSKLTRSKPARRSEATTPTAEFGGSLQQINKPQPAPRLSITGGQARPQPGPGGPGSPVQAAVSDSHLNLSTQCNASPLPQDDPFHVPAGGSQSENSYADTTLVFTHATSVQGLSPVLKTPHATVGHHLQHHQTADLRGDESDSSSGEDAEAGDASTVHGCCDHPYDISPDSSPPAPGGQLHPHHYHHATVTGAANGSTNPTHYPPHNHHHHTNPHLHHAHHHPHTGQHYHHHHHSGTRYHAPNGVGGSTSPSVLPVDGSSQPGGAGSLDSQKGPPPLPPKPKILPMKPSNWGHPSGVATAYGASGGDGGNGSGSNTGTSGSTNSNSSSGTCTSSSSSTGSSSTNQPHHHHHHHHLLSTNDVGGSAVAGGGNSILASSANRANESTANAASSRMEGNRRSASGGGGVGGNIADSGQSVISAAVAQARSVYFDQGNSSFV